MSNIFFFLSTYVKRIEWKKKRFHILYRKYLYAFKFSLDVLNFKLMIWIVQLGRGSIKKKKIRKRKKQKLALAQIENNDYVHKSILLWSKWKLSKVKWKVAITISKYSTYIFINIFLLSCFHCTTAAYFV